MLADLGIQGLVVADVEGDGSGMLDAGGEGLCGLESSAGW